MSGDAPPFRIPELTGDMALKAALWVLSVAILNLLVGSPVTDLYVGFSIVAAAFWTGKKAAGLFEEPPSHGDIVLVDSSERRYRGTLSEEGRIRLVGPDGGEWTGSAWNGRWTLTDPRGRSWWGRVGRKGRVQVHDEDGAELRGTLEPGDTDP